MKSRFVTLSKFLEKFFPPSCKDKRRKLADGVIRMVSESAKAFENINGGHEVDDKGDRNRETVETRQSGETFRMMMRGG